MHNNSRLKNPGPYDAGRPYRRHLFNSNSNSLQRSSVFESQGEYVNLNTLRNQHTMRGRSQRHPGHSNISVKNNTNSVLKNDAHFNECKFFICPGCSLQFDCIYRNGRYVGRVPLILECHHTLCQECIQRGDSVSIICPTCKNSVEAPNKRLIDSIQARFTPNFYLIGLIMWCKPQGRTVEQISLVPLAMTLNNKRISSVQSDASTSESNGKKCCFNSCNKTATYECKECEDVYCSTCCENVHSSGRSLCLHRTSEIPKKNFSAELSKCTDHNAYNEFLCLTCNVNACCYCFINKHNSHDQEYLWKLNAHEETMLESYIVKTQELLKQLKWSQKKLEDICSNRVETVKKQIYKYFADLHGQLYFIQIKLIEDLNHQPTIKSDLDNLIKKWRDILVETEDIHNKKMNLKSILQQLQEVHESPCYLWNKASDDSNLLEFQRDPVLEHLDELLKIKNTMDDNLKLLNEYSLPEGYVKESTESDSEILSSSSSKSLKKEETNKCNKAKKSQHRQTKSKLSTHCLNRRQNNRIVIEDKELVEVTHIESLECFYVQLKKEQGTFIQLCNDIEGFVLMGASLVTSPEINSLYITPYETKNEKLWCRGRLVGVKNNEKETLYEICLIDFGTTRLLNINQLREMTPNFAQKKPFAIKCELYNPSFVNWSRNAHIYMGKIINGKQTFIFVKSINDGVYQVDLMISSSDRGLTSVTDILIHTCADALSSEKTNSEIQIPFSNDLKVRSFIPTFQRKQIEMVKIANVVDPHHIFVHMGHYDYLFDKMRREMKTYYKNYSENCYPIEGSFIVVEHKDPIRGNWHRAFVKKVDVIEEKVNVLLVDWGNSVTVPCSAVRKLIGKFVALAAQATLLKLAHIEPYNSASCWSRGATDFLLTNLITQTEVKMLVYNTDPLEVVLFEVGNNSNICINTQLVLNKFADSTGIMSQTLEWKDSDLQFSNDNSQCQPQLQIKKSEVCWLDNIEESSEEECEEEHEQAEFFVKQQITIMKIVNPGLIYVKFSHLEEEELELYRDLQGHYNRHKETKESWREEELCVVLQGHAFVRGKILNKIENEDLYKVNLYDSLTEVVVPLDRIFIYVDYFKRFPYIVYKCHLANIRPAGGDNWSLSSTEMLERIWKKHGDNFYASKLQEDTKVNSIPLMMWYSRLRINGAFEPSIYKYVCINRSLVRLGYAYATSTARYVTCVQEVAENVNELKKSDSNVVTTMAIVHREADTQSVEEQQLPLLQAIEKASRIDSVNSTRSSDWVVLMEEELNENSKEGGTESPYHYQELKITDWRPPFSIKKPIFNAYITCGEEEGHIFIRDADLQPVYEDMEANLRKFFDEYPTPGTTHTWEVGQVCTISYEGSYYRGKIQQVIEPNEIKVIMVDFGSDHTLSPSQLYNEILYPDLPVFATKVKLYGVDAKSDDGWTQADYEALLDKTPQYGKIVVVGELDVETPSVEVYTDKGENFNDLLVMMCPNLVRTHCEVQTTKSDDELALVEDEQIDTACMKYIVDEIPEEMLEGLNPMNIVEVVSYNKIILKPVNANYSNIIKLNSEIKKCYKLQPDLEDVGVGTACICPYSEDGEWYRAVVYDTTKLVQSGYVVVIFVDYGNIDKVAANSIKAMRADWFKLSVNTYVANLNVELVVEERFEDVENYMRDSLLSEDKLVNILSKDPLLIELFDDPEHLCYQSLVDEGILRKKC